MCGRLGLGASSTASLHTTTKGSHEGSAARSFRLALSLAAARCIARRTLPHVLGLQKAQCVFVRHFAASRRRTVQRAGRGCAHMQRHDYQVRQHTVRRRSASCGKFLAGCPNAPTAVASPRLSPLAGCPSTRPRHARRRPHHRHRARHTRIRTVIEGDEVRTRKLNGCLWSI